jgi:eukaryotic-like serine/threonine-protein kinase
MPLSAGTRLGHYEIRSLLGAGAMGEVYRALDPRLGREVAIKILPAAFAADAERMRRFEQEVRATGQLNHPNLLVVHDVGMEGGTPYLVTEVLEGETLRDRLNAGPLPPAKGVTYAIQILGGLAAAHARGIIHRDLKPENLFLLRDGRAKILDFGIAKLTHPETAAVSGTTLPTVTSSHGSGTDPSIVIGTLGYMSPEQVRGLPVDHRSDLFSFGAVLYEMLTGHRAFRGATPADTATAILREEPPEMPVGRDPISPGLERIVRHSLEKEPEARFQSASDVAFALELLAAAPRGANGPTPDRGRLRRWLLPLVAGVALLATGIWIGHRAGAPAPVETASNQKVTFQRGIVNGAGFGADDHTVLYSAEWDGGVSEVFTSDTRSPGSQRSIVAGARLLAVSPSNELAVLLEYTGMAHNLAVGTLARVPATGGSPRKVVENVMHADWSPDGSELAVARAVRGRWQVEYPIGNVLYVSSGWITHVRVSPDGDRVAFLDHPIFPDDRGDVVTVDRKGTRRVLSDGWGSVQGLAWSPDGDEIKFTASQAGVTRSVFAVSRNGRLRSLASPATSVLLHDISPTGASLLSSTRIWSGIRARVRGESVERELTWLDWSIPQDLSPDGRLLLFSEQGIGGGDHYSICVRGTDGSPPVRLGEGGEGALSPDGQWVLAVRFWVTPPELQLLPTGVGEPRILPETGLENIAGTCFFPDGDRILIVGNLRGHGTRSFVRRVNGGPLQPVTPEGARVIHVSTVAISPDGGHVVAILPGVGPTLYPSTGGAARPVLGALPEEVPVGWARDSRALFVSKTVGGSFPWKVYRIDLDTGARSPFLESPGPPDHSGVKMGLRFMGYDEQSYVASYSRTLDDLYVVQGIR